LAWSKGIKALEEPCYVCGSTENVEMHHVKSLKLLKPLKNMIADKQRAILRKQIHLCKLHLLQVHNYNWRNSAISMNKLKKQVIISNEKNIINSVDVGEPSDG
jgi:hypothetical protein